MKKHILLLTICILGISGIKLSANPMPIVVNMSINELAFDEKGNWQIEVPPYTIYENSKYHYEIISKAGKAKIINLPQKPQEEVYILTQEKLEHPLPIMQEGDSIRINIYYEGEVNSASEWYDYLCFGNHPSATIGSPKEGQSIILKGFTYALSNNPTIGKDNNYEDNEAVIVGTLYSKEGEVVKNEKYSILYNYGAKLEYVTTDIGSLQTNDQGEFKATVLAAKHKELVLRLNRNEYKLKEIDVNLYPNDTISCDFYVTDSYDYYSLEEQSNERLFKVYPNPVGKDKTLNYEIDLSVNTPGIIAEIYSLSGKLALTQRVEENVGTINVSSLAKGSYILKFNGEKGDQYSTKILIE